MNLKDKNNCNQAALKADIQKEIETHMKVEVGRFVEKMGPAKKREHEQSWARYEQCTMINMHGRCQKSMFCTLTTTNKIVFKRSIIGKESEYTFLHRYLYSIG